MRVCRKTVRKLDSTLGYEQLWNHREPLIRCYGAESYKDLCQQRAGIDPVKLGTQRTTLHLSSPRITTRSPKPILERILVKADDVDGNSYALMPEMPHERRR